MPGKPSQPSGTTPWTVVLGVLLGLPLLLAVVMSQWLGTPRERFDGGEVFATLGVAQVPTDALFSLYYGKLFFVRLEVGEKQRPAFLRNLAHFEVSRGTSQRPISLKLERAWWSPPERVEGTYWKHGRTTLWNPDNQPESFFAVVMDRSADSEG